MPREVRETSPVLETHVSIDRACDCKHIILSIIFVAMVQVPMMCSAYPIDYRDRSIGRDRFAGVIGSSPACDPVDQAIDPSIGGHRAGAIAGRKIIRHKR